MAKAKNILIITEAQEGKLCKNTRSIISVAQGFNAEASISSVTLGTDSKTAAGELADFGLKDIFTIECSSFEPPYENALLEALESIYKETLPEIVISASNRHLKELSARLAVRLKCTFITSCLSIKNEEEAVICERSIYEGGALAEFKCNTPLITSLATNISSKNPSKKDTKGSIKELFINVSSNEDSPVKIISTTEEEQNAASILDASVVIGGGRGMGSKEGFEILSKLAECFGGAVGATRPPCDNLWADESMQIGVSGKCIRPDVYFAIGISGSKLHTQGLLGTKAIVAINPDKDTPIFKIADYGITCEWQKIIPALIAKSQG